MWLTTLYKSLYETYFEVLSTYFTVTFIFKIFVWETFAKPAAKFKTFAILLRI
jgi:hypothetical protein